MSICNAYVVPPLAGYLSAAEARAKLGISQQALNQKILNGSLKSARKVGDSCYVLEENEIREIVAARNAPKCGCCSDMDSAIAQHLMIVENVLKNLKITPGSSAYNSYNDYDSAYSDGMEALWKALRSFDPSKMRKVGAYLYYKIRQAVIDGRRQRGVDPRRSSEVKQQKASVLGAESYDALEMDLPTSAEWSGNDDDRAQRLIVLAKFIDPLLPEILLNLADGNSQAETAKDLDVTAGDVRRKIEALRAYCKTFPDMTWRPDVTYSGGKWSINND